MPAENMQYRDQNATESEGVLSKDSTPEGPSKKTATTRVVAIAIAIVAVFLLGWYFVPGDLPFSPPVPR
jgi:hypothetical protein